MRGARRENLQPGWLTRNRLLPRIGLALAIITLGTIVWEITLGRNEVRVYTHEIVSDTLPPEFDGLRIVHLSDIHAGSLGSNTRLADRMVAIANAERPDLVVFTGDYGQLSDFALGPQILGRIKAPLGKFAVLGNHDFGTQERATDNWTSPEHKRLKIEALSRAFQSQGFRLLMNDSAIVERRAANIAVLGVGVYDPHHHFDDADMLATERNAAPASFRLLLAHNPQYWDNFVQGQRPIDLTLSGHTHGAQIGIGIGPLMWSPAALQFRHWGGLYRSGRQYLNVNRGVGYVILPFRLNMPAEVSVIVVRSSRTAGSRT